MESTKVIRIGIDIFAEYLINEYIKSIEKLKTEKSDV